ncbi:hypothetical protein [Rhizobium sullae]|uniref:hypothetical protein n=1 Tax=Rhizobium sullae TaxID=50338 RepID=UPI0015C65300|nr:hypothetical protein [Rhizobium sullae]
MDQQSIHDRIMSRKSSDVVPNHADDRNRPRRNWLKTTALSFLGIVTVGAAGYVAGRYEAIGNFLSQPAVAETNAAASTPADTPFRQHAKQAGLQACANIFPGLGALLTNGSQYSVQSTWNIETPDKHAVQALVGMNYATEGYSGTAAGVVVAAPTGSLCEGSMVRVAPFTTSCADMPALLPKGSKLTNNLAQISVYELPDNGGNAMLLPTGDGCAVVSVASATGTQGGGK